MWEMSNREMIKGETFKHQFEKLYTITFSFEKCLFLT